MRRALRVFLIFALGTAAAAQMQGPPASVQRKMRRLQDAIHERQSQDADLSPVGRTMGEFEPLMRAGRFKEAEAVLDRALTLAGGN